MEAHWRLDPRDGIEGRGVHALDYAGKLIVVTIPSFGARYISTKLFEGLPD